VLPENLATFTGFAIGLPLPRLQPVGFKSLVSPQPPAPDRTINRGF
jgi:hypothetical protein